MTYSNCKSCGARLFFAETANGRFIPMDAQPDPEGKYYLLGGKAVAYELAQGLEAHEQHRYTTHFVTCPNSRAHRRKS